MSHNFEGRTELKLYRCNFLANAGGFLKLFIIKMVKLTENFKELNEHPYIFYPNNCWYFTLMAFSI